MVNMLNSISLKTKKEWKVSIITYGAIITSIKVPDRFGKLDEVVLGFDSLEQYTKPNPYFGA